MPMMALARAFWLSVNTDHLVFAGFDQYFKRGQGELAGSHQHNF